jgi:hypothetical protein
MSPQRFRRVLCVFLTAASFGWTATAHGQGELNRPYKLHIVVHVARNRLLTDVFREGIERELRDGFRAALGDMGQVEVTHDHPRLAEVLTRGLQSLDGWTDRSDQKTHFVLIDFSGVHYEIQAKQYDGTVGRASPVVRRDRTRDRDFVAKAAALLIKQDFGILGTVLTAPQQPQKQGQSVPIELRGGGLGNLARWVQKDEVFFLVPPGGGKSPALNWSLLQVVKAPAEDARDGMCECRFFHRYQVPNITGYRCIKVGTVQTALRLRWMQASPRGLKPLTNSLTVAIRRHDFDHEDTTKLMKTTGNNGLVETVRDLESKGVFTNVAFVSVTSGMQGNKPQVPIALVDDQPLIIEVVNATRDENTLFASKRATWQQGVANSVVLQNNLFKLLGNLSSKGDQREEVIKQAEAGVKRSEEDRQALKKEKQDLLNEAKENNIRLETPAEDRHLKALEDGENVLREFIKQQKNIEKTENDPQQKKWRSEVERAKILEKDLEYGKAIDIYKQILKEGFDNQQVKEHLEQKEKEWKTKDEKHEKAREFCYRVWPTLDSAGLEENLPKARDAFEKCKAARDDITIQKLLRGTEGHADRLAKELEQLHPELQEGDEKQAAALKKISAGILKLGTDINNYLAKAKPSS